MEYKLTEGELFAAADADIVDELAATLGISLPSDYLDFLRQHSGGEGFIGEDYLIFWKAEELARFNREYEVDKYAPNILLFASNGGGEAYGFDLQSVSMPVVRIPFIGMDRSDAVFVSEKFTDIFLGKAQLL